MRILFVVRPDSVHAARWINQIADSGWDLHVFPTHDVPWHEDYRNVTLYQLSRVAGHHSNRGVKRRALWPWSRGAYRIGGLLQKGMPSSWFSRAVWLARLIKWLKPDLLHTLEFQMGGYLTLEARSHVGARFPLWAITNWGSDIYLYGPLAGHREKIERILTVCDYYGCECSRDLELARIYGFRGTLLPVLPVAGGFHVEEMQKNRRPGPTSERRLVLLKGYQHWAGRSLFGLRALELCASVLTERRMRVAIYLANPDVQLAAESLAARTGLRLEIIPPSSHEEIIRLHGEARVSIGLSISDGLSTSALEAMLMGSFPIQSDTCCLGELVRNGESALFVPAEDPQAIAKAIDRAIADDNLVDRAASINLQLALERLDYSVVQPQVIAMYEQTAERCRIAQ